MDEPILHIVLCSLVRRMVHPLPGILRQKRRYPVNRNPPTFLAQYGAGFWKGGLLEIVGLFHQPDISAPPYWENVVTWNLRQRRGATAFRRAMSRSVTTVWKPLYLDAGALELESPVAVLGP
jgi:hypothetical protein